MALFLQALPKFMNFQWFFHCSPHVACGGWDKKKQEKAWWNKGAHNPDI